MHSFLLIIVQVSLCGFYLEKKKLKSNCKNECNAPCILVNKMFSSSGLLYMFCHCQKKRPVCMTCWSFVQLKWNENRLHFSNVNFFAVFHSNLFDSSKSTIGALLFFFYFFLMQKERCKCATLYALWPLTCIIPSGYRFVCLHFYFILQQTRFFFVIYKIYYFVKFSQSIELKNEPLRCKQCSSQMNDAGFGVCVCVCYYHRNELP